VKIKKGNHITPLQPLTLAAFLPWGSSEGAGRMVSAVKVIIIFKKLKKNISQLSQFMSLKSQYLQHLKKNII